MTWGIGGYVFHLLGLAVVFVLFNRTIRRAGIAPEACQVLGAAALLGGLVGALVLNSVATALATAPVGGEPGPLSGRSWIGGLLGGYLMVEATKRVIGLRRSTGDAFALALPLGEAVGRIGCLLGGCCFGRPAELPWSIVQHGAARHPSQLYAAAEAVLLWGVLRWAAPRMPREGDLFKLYLMGYAVARFLLEFTRDHPQTPEGSPILSTAQWACLGGLLALAVLWLPGFLRARRGTALSSSASQGVY